MTASPSTYSSDSARPRILLAEDNPQDVFLLKEAFLNQGIVVDIDCIFDGDELLDRLKMMAGNTQDDPYELIVLDMHLPKRSAEEVLSALAGEPNRTEVPIVILTNLVSDKDKEALLALGVREVLAKPNDLNQYFELAARLNELATA